MFLYPEPSELDQISDQRSDWSSTLIASEERQRTRNKQIQNPTENQPSIFIQASHISTTMRIIVLISVYGYGRSAAPMLLASVVRLCYSSSSKSFGSNGNAFHS